MTNVALEGIVADILPVIREKLKRAGYDVVYSHERAGRHRYADGVIGLGFEVGDITNGWLIDQIKVSSPDVVVVCNAAGFMNFFRLYKERKETLPLIVLTGGGPEKEDAVRQYTPHVLAVPLQMNELPEKINEVVR
ncbi:MAG: hypothetical protein Q7R96_05360 [Nanoarchaeota archaeon]|nr:hypothetical protein [Nanoarchaeota archaeon]